MENLEDLSHIQKQFNMKFQKVVNHWKNLELKYDWLLVMESVEDVMNYHEKIDPGKIRKAWDNLGEVRHGKAHFNSGLSMIIDISAKPGDSILTATARIMDKIISGKIRCIDQYGKIYQNKMGGYFPHTDEIEVLEEMIIDSDNNIIFPEYTEKDINIKQWDGGTHWYAYVGDFWVTSLDGKNKFDTEERARSAAQYYLYRLNQEDFEFKGEENIHKGKY